MLTRLRSSILAIVSAIVMLFTPLSGMISQAAQGGVGTRFALLGGAFALAIPSTGCDELCVYLRNNLDGYIEAARQARESGDGAAMAAAENQLGEISTQIFNACGEYPVIQY